jgi:DUF971 family protein
MVGCGCEKMMTMSGKKEVGILSLLALGLYAVLVFFGNVPSKAEHPELSEAVFLVS